MNEYKDDYCNHEWDSDSPVRLCLRCGEVRMLPNGDSNPRVLWAGRDTKDDPLQLPQADKAIIAGVAQRVGVKKAEEAIGIPMEILRAWVGAYCRKPHKPSVEPVAKIGRPRKNRVEDVPQEGAPVPALAVIITKFAPGNCLICEGELFNDSDYKPHYIQTPGRKLWLCGVCAEGVAKLFKALDIPCQVIKEEDHA